MAAIRIALDTSIFRRDPRMRSGAFEALSRFAESGYVEILIPDVVAREFITLPTDKAQAVAGLRRSLADLRRGTQMISHQPSRSSKRTSRKRVPPHRR